MPYFDKQNQHFYFFFFLLSLVQHVLYAKLKGLMRDKIQVLKL